MGSLRPILNELGDSFIILDQALHAQTLFKLNELNYQNPQRYSAAPPSFHPTL